MIEETTTNNTTETQDVSESTIGDPGGAEPSEVPDILQGLGAEQVSLLVGFHDHIASLAEQRKLPDGEYLGALDDDKKARLLLDKKLKDATERRAQVKEQYEQVTKAAHDRLGERKATLQEEIFSADGDVLVQVTLAPDEKLKELAGAATRAGTSGLGLAKAVLAACNDRGLDEVAMPILQAFPTLEQSWREYQAIPDDAILARQLDPARIEQAVPAVDADRLKARPRVGPY